LAAKLSLQQTGRWLAQRQFHLTAIKLSLQPAEKTKWAYLTEIKLSLQQIDKKTIRIYKRI